jgi:hypothetical protein
MVLEVASMLLGPSRGLLQVNHSIVLRISQQSPVILSYDNSPFE